MLTGFTANGLDMLATSTISVRLPRLLAVKAMFAVLLTLLMLPAPASAATCPAAATIISAGKTYDQAARAGSATAFANGVARYSDMRAIALFALGRYRKDLPIAREAEFVSLTKSFMGRFMLEYGKDFRVGTLQIIDCTGPASNMTVTARTSGGDRITFRVYKAGSRWMVRDMRVSGIWLVQQMRSAFVGTLSRTKGDMEELFKFLRR